MDRRSSAGREHSGAGLHSWRSTKGAWAVGPRSGSGVRGVQGVAPHSVTAQAIAHREDSSQRDRKYARRQGRVILLERGLDRQAPVAGAAGDQLGCRATVP